jgi:tetratricopeptide (TPR) repeat protein
MDKNSYFSLIKHPTVEVLLNFGFLVLIILAGAILGSNLRRGKISITEEDKNLKILSSHSIGIGSAFICLPFIASFLHLNYESILLPLGDKSPSVFIEQIFMLISLAGIASYLGYGLLDNIANKVLQSEVKVLNEESKETKHDIDSLQRENKELKQRDIELRIDLLYIKAKDAVEAAQRYSQQKPITDEAKLASQKKYHDAISFINEGLKLIDKKSNYKLYDKFLVLKAFVLKRINDVQGALKIIKELVKNDNSNPVLLYNLACYTLICKEYIDIKEIKELVTRALTVPTKDKTHQTLQKKLIEKVLSKLDDDIKDLFNDDEINHIRTLIKP